MKIKTISRQYTVLGFFAFQFILLAVAFFFSDRLQVNERIAFGTLALLGAAGWVDTIYQLHRFHKLSTKVK